MSAASHTEPPRDAVADAVRRALVEDLTPLGDLTSMLLPRVAAEALFVPRQDGVLAGTACATETFRRVDPDVELTWSAADGDVVTADVPVAVVRGELASILTAERTALNFLSHLSGVASETRRFVDAVEGTGARIWDTRKTTPGLRSLQKAAVRAGGGANHRGNLSDWILLKDNHLSVLGIDEAVRLARERWPARTVHVECDTVEQALQALEAGADALLLDNMPPELVSACVEMAFDHSPDGERRVLLEVSGGITVATVASYARLGVDCISVGGLTNSAPVLDIGLDIEPRGIRTAPALAGEGS